MLPRCLVAFVLGVALACAGVGAQAADGDMRLGLLFPLTEHATGFQRAAVSVQAVRDVNARRYGSVNLTRPLHDGVRMDVAVNDTLRSSLHAVAGAVWQMGDAFGATALIGPALSSVAVSVQYVASAYGVPQMSPSATASALSSEDLFPTFLRTAPKDRDQGMALGQLVAHFGWRRVGVLHSPDTYGIGIDQAVRAFMTSDEVERGFVISKSLPVESEDVDVGAANRATLLEFVAADVRIVVLATTVTYGLPLLHTAAEMTADGALAEQFQFVAADGMLQDEMVAELLELGDVASLAMVNALRGAIGIRPSDAIDSLEYNAFVERDEWRSAVPAHFPELLAAIEREPENARLGARVLNLFSSFSHDAVWAYAVALSDNLYAGLGARATDADALIDAVTRTQFTGLSGTVAFDASGDRVGQYQVVNLGDDVAALAAKLADEDDGAAFRIVGRWVSLANGGGNGGDGSVSQPGRLTISDGDAIRWYDGSTRVPADTPSYLVKEVEIASWVMILFGILGALGFLFCLFIMAIIFLRRDHPSLKSSTPLFGYIIASGVILALLDILLWLSPDVTVGLCITRGFLLNVAFTLVHGSIFCKSYRVYLIFSQGGASKITLSNRDLLLALACVLGLDFVILILWLTFTPMVVYELVDDEEMPTRSYSTCGTEKHSWVWFTLVLIYKGCTLIFGMFLAFVTRRIKNRDFNESKYIGWCTYSTGIIVVVVVPVLYLIIGNVDNTTSVHFVLSMAIYLVFMGTLGLLYGPRVRRVLFPTKHDAMSADALRRHASRTSLAMNNRRRTADRSRATSSAAQPSVADADDMDEGKVEMVDVELELGAAAAAPEVKQQEAQEA